MPVQAEERLQILKLIEEGKVSADEGARLLGALHAGQQAAGTAAGAAGGEAAPAGRWLRVQVTDTVTGTSKVRINLPLAVVSAVVRFGRRFIPPTSGIDADRLEQAIQSGHIGKLVDVFDDDSGDRVEVFIE